MTNMVETTINKRWTLILPEHRAARGEVWDTWEAERLASMHEHLGPGDVVYDIGAEEGDMPALWSSWGCDVALFEPNPRVWPNIRAIWEANELPAPIGLWVGFAGSTLTDAVDALGGTGWWEGWPVCAYGPVIGDHGFLQLNERPDVPSITIDWAVARMSAPTALTIDVEGSELHVLWGAETTLTLARPKVWVSVHPTFMVEQYGHSPDRLHRFMEGLGYVGTLLAADHEEHWFYRHWEDA